MQIEKVTSVSLLLLFAGLVLGCERNGTEPQPAGEKMEEASTMLACIAPIIVEKCSTAGCHDSETRVHGMDLSTPSGIYDGFINQDGLDMCTNRIVDRVVPGDPDASFLMQKVEGLLGCEQSARMPPSPAAPLVAGEVELLRAWIASGATADCSSSTPLADGSGGTSSSGAVTSTNGVGGSAGGSTTATGAGGNPGSTTTDTTTTTGAGASTSTTNASGSTTTTATASTTSSGAGGTSAEEWDGVCTTEAPCPSANNENYLCTGAACSDVWECFLHKPASTRVHPCSETILSFCACDGVTFESPSDCPDRPFVHVGACGEGVNCDVWKASCDDEPPECPEGELPSIVDECYGDCVPATSCRCQYHWECGDNPDFMCDAETLSCLVRPPVEE